MVLKDRWNMHSLKDLVTHPGQTLWHMVTHLSTLPSSGIPLQQWCDCIQQWTIALCNIWAKIAEIDTWLSADTSVFWKFTFQWARKIGTCYIYLLVLPPAALKVLIMWHEIRLVLGESCGPFSFMACGNQASLWTWASTAQIPWQIDCFLKFVGLHLRIMEDREPLPLASFWVVPTSFGAGRF